LKKPTIQSQYLSRRNNTPSIHHITKLATRLEDHLEPPIYSKSGMRVVVSTALAWVPVLRCSPSMETVNECEPCHGLARLQSLKGSSTTVRCLMDLHASSAGLEIMEYGVEQDSAQYSARREEEMVHDETGVAWVYYTSRILHRAEQQKILMAQREVHHGI
jgi:hypothetical protein